ncbi:MAG: hypothetical protein AB7J34_23365 [Limisphaerales bacterium]
MGQDAQNPISSAPLNAEVDIRPESTAEAQSGHHDPEPAPEQAAFVPREDDRGERVPVTQTGREVVADGNPLGDRRDDPLAVVATKIDEAVARVLTAFGEKLAYDQTKQVQIDRLHEELLQYRSDLVSRAARPLAHGMIQLHDDIGKLLSALRAKPAEQLTPARFFSLLEGLQDDVEIVLGQNGIAAFREPGCQFEPRRQRALKRVSTFEAALAGTVAERIRPGFEQGVEILEKERVSTYEFVRSPAGTADNLGGEIPAGDETSHETQEKEA